MRSAALSRPKAEKTKTFRVYPSDEDAFHKLSQVTGVNQSAVLRLLLQMGMESPNALVRTLHNSWKTKRFVRRDVNTNAEFCLNPGESVEAQP